MSNKYSTQNKYVLKTKPQEKSEKNEIRVGAGGITSSYLRYASGLYQDRITTEPFTLLIKASGAAISKACTVAEILRHRIKDLSEIIRITHNDVTDEFEPLEEGLSTVLVHKKLTVIEIKLTTEKLDGKNILGFQPPLPYSEVQDFNEPRERNSSSRPKGTRGGRGGGRNRGPRSRGEYNDQNDRYDRGGERYERSGNDRGNDRERGDRNERGDRGGRGGRGVRGGRNGGRGGRDGRGGRERRGGRGGWNFNNRDRSASNEHENYSSHHKYSEEKKPRKELPRGKYEDREYVHERHEESDRAYGYGGRGGYYEDRGDRSDYRTGNYNQRGSYRGGYRQNYQDNYYGGNPRGGNNLGYREEYGDRRGERSGSHERREPYQNNRRRGGGRGLRRGY